MLDVLWWHNGGAEVCSCGSQIRLEGRGEVGDWGARTGRIVPVNSDTSLRI